MVGQDEREGGLRAILNFGHTFGHAIETGLGYGAWLHGEAVGCGMVLAAELSARLGLVDADLVPRLRQHLDVRVGWHRHTHDGRRTIDQHLDELVAEGRARRLDDGRFART